MACEQIGSCAMSNSHFDPGFVRVPETTYETRDYATRGLPVSVRISSFFIGKGPVTQREYEDVASENPSHYGGALRPVETVSWWDAVAYCNGLSIREGLQTDVRSSCRRLMIQPVLHGDTSGSSEAARS